MHIVKPILQMLPFPGILILDTRLSVMLGIGSEPPPWGHKSQQPILSRAVSLNYDVGWPRWHSQLWMASLGYHPTRSQKHVDYWNGLELSMSHESPPPDPSRRLIQLLSVWVASCLISLNLCDAIYRNRTFACIFTGKKGIGMKM